MRRRFMGCSFVGVALLVMAVVPFFVTEIHAAGEWKPTKPIQFIAPYAPGGGSDILARSIASIVEAGKFSPQPLIVTNMPGGGTTIGTTSVAQAKGNTHMLLTFISAQVSAPMVVGTTAATYRDLTMISGLALDQQTLVVKQDSRFKSIKDIVEELKKKPNSLVVGGGGMGGEDQMCNRLLERATGLKFRYVSFNSGGECITALLGGHVDMVWVNPAEFMPQYEAKMVHPIAVANETRMPDFPDVPTFRDAGYDVTFKFFRGIAAPPGIPAETVAFYEHMMKQVSDSKAWKDNYLKKYMLTPWYLNSKEFTQSVAKSETLFREILKELGFAK
ncbi:MAG: Bug family tripartite tricarboxylate transporter substrate binding protein [Syntrophales bacterium]